MKIISNFKRAPGQQLLILLLFILMSSQLYNCKKETDLEPFIDFIKPEGSITVVAGDSIFVEANISDDVLLTQVSIQVLDLNGSPVTTSLVYQTNNNAFHIKTLYHINNTLLESGKYLLTIFASDAKSSVHASREIEIQAIPLQLLKRLAITKQGATLNIFQLDSSQTYSTLANITGDFSNSSINSRYQRFNVLGRSSGTFSIIDAISGNVLSQLPRPCPIASPCFENLQSQNDLNFISFYDGNVKAYDISGAQKFNIQQEGYFRPDQLFLTPEYFYVEEYYIAQHQTRLGTYFYPSGVIRQESVLDMDVLKIFKRSQDELYLFGESNGNAILEIFNRNTNRTVLQRNFGPIQINSVYEMAPHDFYIASRQGLWHYLVNTGILTQIQTAPLQSINFDPINNEFYLSEQNVLRVMDSGMSEIRQYSFPDSILNIHFLYNR